MKKNSLVKTFGKAPVSAVLAALLTLALSTASSRAASQSDMYFTISSYSGGSESLVSWTLTGPIISGAGTRPGATNAFSLTQVGAVGTGIFNTNVISDGTSYIISTGGTFTDTTSSSNSQISALEFQVSSGNTILNLQLASPIAMPQYDALGYAAGSTTNLIIPVAFSAFNAGTYTSANSSPGFSPNLYTSVTVEAVPEPSSYLLFGLGGLALLVACRRKSA